MAGSASVLAVVAARGGSKGLKRKNLLPLKGKPLVAWPIRAALGSSVVSKVVVSTDDVEIAAAATAAGASVPFMRPAALATDTASSMEVVLHALDFMSGAGSDFEYVVLLEPTSPLTESQDIDRAFDMLCAAAQIADSIVGICPVEAAHPEYDVRLSAEGLISPYSSADFRSLRRRQDIDELYFLEGSLYLSRVDAFRKIKSFYSERTLGYQVPRWKSIEVDELLDFICVEAILDNRDRLSQSLT